jgi:hypothetical protein
VDYNATAATMTFAVAPPLGSKLWAVWFSNAVLTS